MVSEFSFYDFFFSFLRHFRGYFTFVAVVCALNGDILSMRCPNKNIKDVGKRFPLKKRYGAPFIPRKYPLHRRIFRCLRVNALNKPNIEKRFIQAL